MATRIRTVAQLNALLAAGKTEFCIVLGGGEIRSSKNIRRWDDGKYDVLNEIDGSHQVLTEEELYTQSNIGKAITSGAFFAY